MSSRYAFGRGLANVFSYCALAATPVLLKLAKCANASGQKRASCIQSIKRCPVLTPLDFHWSSWLLLCFCRGYQHLSTYYIKPSSLSKPKQNQNQTQNKTKTETYYIKTKTERQRISAVFICRLLPQTVQPWKDSGKAQSLLGER